MSKLKLMTIIGTRPEIIRLSAVISVMAGFIVMLSDMIFRTRFGRMGSRKIFRGYGGVEKRDRGRRIFHNPER